MHTKRIIKTSLNLADHRLEFSTLDRRFLEKIIFSFVIDVAPIGLEIPLFYRLIHELNFKK